MTKQELKIYRERRYPMPREDWKSRLLRRESLKNGFVLYPQTCQATGAEILSTFPPGKGWKVLENEAYIKAI